MSKKRTNRRNKNEKRSKDKRPFRERIIAARIKRRKESENKTEDTAANYNTSDIEENGLIEEVVGVRILLDGHNYPELMDRDDQIATTSLKKSVPTRWNASCTMLK